MLRDLIVLLLTVIAVAVTASCVRNLKLTPTSATVMTGQTATFTATFDPNGGGGISTAWTLTQNGSSSSCAPGCGTLSISAGFNSSIAIYTAPPTVPTPSAVTLTFTVTDNQPASLTATATITVTSSTGIGVTVSPASALVLAGTGTQPFTATVANDPSNKGVNWTLTASGANCSPACGALSQITTTGVLYAAPATVPAAPNNTPTLTATSIADGKTTSTAAITITPPIVVVVTPSGASVLAGTGTQPFTAIVTNDASNKGVNWTLSSTGTVCTAAGNPCGTVPASSASGAQVTYTAPAIVPSSPTVTLTATSAADATKSASAIITLTAPTPIIVSVTPGTATVPAGTGTQFSATVSNTTNLAVNWTLTGAGCSGSGCGTISPATSTSGGMVTYTAPPSPPNPNIVTIKATAAADGTTFATATITVTAATAMAPRYLFEINGDSTISTYAVVPSTGQLRSVSYLSTSATVGLAETAALNPNGNVLYAAESVPAGQQLTTYSISAGGVLSQVASTMNAEGTFGHVLADPLGRFLWVADNSTGQILSYALDSTTGVPGTQTIAASVANVEAIAADPTGTYLFSEDISGNVSAYTVASGGTLVPLGTPPPSHPFSHDTMIVDPAGQHLYVMDDSSINQLFGYTISSTGLTSISGSPFIVPNNGEVDTQMTIDPTSSFLYAMDSSPTQPIDAFTIGAGGALTPLTETLQVPSFPGVQQIIVDPSGKFLFAAYGGAHEVWTYGITQTGASRGTITPVNRMRLRASSVIDAQLLSTGTAAVQFTPESLYVTNSISNSVSQFSINPSTGTLTSLGAPFTGGSGAAIGTQPQGLAVQPNDNLLYVGDFASAQIDSFSVTTNGVLSSSGLQPVVVPGESPASLTIDLSGSFLYIADQLGGNIGELQVGSGGALGPTPTTTSSVAGSAPVFVTTESTGQFIYAANSGPGSISTYSISLPNGTLSSVGSSVSAGTGTDWIVADPSGRFLYSTATHSNTLQEFLITAGTGLPTVNSNPFLSVGPSASSPGASSVVVEPTGKFVYATNESLNQIFAFSIDPSTGLLSEIQRNNANSQVADTGTTPIALAVDISGQYLYCVNSGSNDINMYKINLSDGTLTPVGTATVPTGGTTPTGIALTGTLK